MINRSMPSVILNKIVAIMMLLNLTAEWINCTQQCSSSPVITYYKMFSNQSTLITWNQAFCPKMISRYEIQLTVECDMLQLATYQTNETSLYISYNGCLTNECYIRVRGVLMDNTYTDYSPCTTINYQITTTSFVNKGGNICVPISTCPGGIFSSFFINGVTVTGSELLYSNRIIYNSTLFVYGYGLCFTNISNSIVVTEFCNIDVADNLRGCFICSSVSGVTDFVSQADIETVESPIKPSTTHADSTVASYRATYHTTIGKFFSSTTVITTPDYAMIQNKTYNENSTLIIISGVVSAVVFVIFISGIFVLITVISFARYKRHPTEQGMESHPVYEDITNLEVDNFTMNECTAYQTVSGCSVDMENCPAYIKTQ